MPKKQIYLYTPNFLQSVAALAKMQQEDGSFLSFSSPTVHTFTTKYIYHTTFVTSLILDSLTQLPPHPTLHSLMQKAAQFLLTQKTNNWSWNYWKRQSDEERMRPYPDDLDDTFCALSALFHYDKKLIDGIAWNHILKLLTSLEHTEGGPYTTWLVAKNSAKKWKDVDLAVNNNIAYFLSITENISLPNITKFVEKCILQKRITSPYYPSLYPIIYFISRWYTGKYTKKLQQILLERKNAQGIWKNPLYTALAVSSLIRLGIPAQKLKKSILYVLQNQKQGVWEAYSFCIDPKRDGKIHYAGSPALTTAFCLEAIHLYQQHIASPPVLSDKKDRIHGKIIETVKQYFTQFDETSRQQITTCLEQILTHDKPKQIPLLPYYFYISLEKKYQHIPDTILIKLGIVNTLGWLAYTIYDDFLDEEGNPTLLSAANVCLRKLTAIGETLLPAERKFTTLFHIIMDTIDHANSREITQYRIKINKVLHLKKIKIPVYDAYQVLADKSLGHALGPLAILFALGLQKTSSEVKQLFLFFIYYLTAKQLSDDMHDFEKDLAKGHITPVGSLLLKKVKRISPHPLSFKKINSTAQKIFWETSVVDICTNITTHIQSARNILQQLSFLANKSLFETLLNSLEQSVQNILDEREKTMQFLKVYKKRNQTFTKKLTNH